MRHRNFDEWYLYGCFLAAGRLGISEANTFKKVLPFEVLAIQMGYAHYRWMER